MSLLLNPIKNILIDGKNRETGTSSNFTYTFLTSIQNPLYYSLESVQLFNSHYTINSNNNKLYWKTTAGSSIISTLTNGNYTATGLASHLTTLMNADNTGAGVFTAIFSTLNNKITISNSVGNFELSFNLTTNSVATALGFNKVAKTGASSYTGDNVVKLSTKYYKIFTDLGQANTHTNSGIENLIAVVPNNVSSGDLISYVVPLAKSFKINNSSISKINIIVKDDEDNIVNLHGADISINLCVAVETL